MKEHILFKLLDSDLNSVSFLSDDESEKICFGVYCRYIIKTTTNHVRINQLSIFVCVFTEPPWHLVIYTIISFTKYILENKTFSRLRSCTLYTSNFS